MREGVAGYETAAHARRIVAAVALAATRDPAVAADALVRLDLAQNDGQARREVGALHRCLTEPRAGLNNLYLHVTFACPPRCSHCYARGGAARAGAYDV